eukprot:CAMPEP_0184978276 /NCGR_PEP_ID=MMETSP1098-20130426/8830_1 /TAXON_ID=89044 /ORGANISM="Spumella elongata, Strain CCAP 955/1" /LENGTH=256 /DNA_ID=CAMNT_0027501395 /DNA_START=57 /DNA_END=827 /DNA_ORIENTATION=-
MLSKAAQATFLRSRCGSRILVAAKFPKFNGARVLSNFQIAHSFSTEKVAKEEDPAAPTEEPKQTTSAVAKYDYDEHDDYDYEEPKTFKDKARVYGVLAMRLGFLALGGICVYFTAKELFPGRMNPNSLFSEAFEKLRYNEDVVRMAGDSMKAFGRDVGRSTEGRRNHIDSYEYKAEDGSKRTRIRFNIKGDKAKVLVWAEIADSQADGEFVYLICQSTKTGKVYTVVDQRDEMENAMRTNRDPSDDLISRFFTKKD